MGPSEVAASARSASDLAVLLARHNRNKTIDVVKPRDALFPIANTEDHAK